MKKRRFYHKDWFILTIIYLIAVLFRIVSVYILSWNRGPHFENYQIAQYIIEGKGYWWDWNGWIPPQPTALLPPIYTYFLVIFMKLFNDPFRIIYIAQSFLNALIIVPAFFLGRHLVDRKTGIIAAGLFAVFPEVAVTSTKLISEPLFIPWVILSFYLFLTFKSRLITEGSYKPFFWLGIIMGITALIKTTGALVIIAFFISLVLIKNKKKYVLRAFLMLGIGFFIGIFPWNLRNLIVMKKPLMLASNFGYNLWRGNHPWGSGTEYLEPGKLSESELPPEYLDYLDKNRPKIEVDMDKFFFNEAIKFIKQDPGRYALLTLKRMLYFVTIDPTHHLTRNVFYIGGYIFILFFGIWGAILQKRKGRLDNIFIIMPILVFCFYVPIVNVPRFRLIAILILVLFSSVPIANLLSKNRYFSRMINSHP